MTTKLIEELFASDIHRHIEEVIKVDQTDEQILLEEINEYVVTDAIHGHYEDILESYAEAPNKPREGVGVWVSGFFGSGKSSFAKILGLTISNRDVVGEGATERFAGATRDEKLTVLLKTINEKIPTHAVIFDVSTDRGIKSGNQTLTEIMYRLFLQSLGYAKDLDLSELEIGLEGRGQLEAFEAEYRSTFGKEWRDEKGKVAFALNEASRVLHSLDPDTYPTVDSWVAAVKNRADITPGMLAERATELMERRRPGESLLFVVDEVGQFVARDVQKMLDLQAIVQSLGRVGRGKHWLVVTSQEQLGEIVSGLDDNRIELARLRDRFPGKQQVHLEPSDISEVTSRRVLSKNADAQGVLGSLFEENRARLEDHTRLTADITLPELDRDGFVDLYPLLPYQVDLVIQVVSGLRTQGGSSKHVGGANRTIINLAQQLLIHPGVDLASRSVGALVRLDHVYDLVENNVGSEVRAKIEAISKDVDHSLAQPVAKAICLLQYVQSVHRTPENISACLHDSVDGDSRLAEVRGAIAALEAANKIRSGEDGYRIPTPAEDDWERTRNGTGPKPGDAHRIHTEILEGFWQPQPSHSLLGTKTFKAGLGVNGREVASGDMTFQMHLAERAEELERVAGELRARSQQEQSEIFWAVALTDAIDRETVQLFRSKEILKRKEREAVTESEAVLVGEEKRRQRRHEDELRRLMRSATLTGSVFFRGNDRSPDESTADVGKAASALLGICLPQVFDRFGEAAVRPGDVKKAVEALLTAENLQGLPRLFSELNLLVTQDNHSVIQVESGPLKEIASEIEQRASYGETANGQYLTGKFASGPFGWDFDAVRLLVLCLLRAGTITVTSKAQTFDSATCVEARETFANNNLFRQAALRPKKSIEFAELVKAATAYKDVFGVEVDEISQQAIVAQLRNEVATHAEVVLDVLSLLRVNSLPGLSVLDGAHGQLKAILRGTQDDAIATFVASHNSIKDAIKRAAELQNALSEKSLDKIKAARDLLVSAWPFLESEPDVGEELRAQHDEMVELLERESFYKEIGAIDSAALAIRAEYERRHQEALTQRIEAYSAAYELLCQTPGWTELGEEEQLRVAGPIRRGMESGDFSAPIPQVRSERDACESRLRHAVLEVHKYREGERLATVNVAGYFASGVETEEQLDAALDGIREECERLIGSGKKIVIG